jgi:cyclopropane fatty-acyl-phospholipid synthase-like methyltransferase
MEIIREMQTYYAKRAPVYDSSMGYDDQETIRSLSPVINRIRSLLDGRKILEIACGPCFWTQFVCEVAASILATDYNESTLDQARQKNLDWDKVTLQRADAYDLSRVQGSFDAAFAVDWFAHVPRSRFHEFLTGLHSRLLPGSLIVFCDQLSGAESFTGRYDNEGNHLQTRVLPDASTCHVIKHFLPEPELNELFARYSDQVEITSYPECRRIVVSYIVGKVAGA